MPRLTMRSWARSHLTQAQVAHAAYKALKQIKDPTPLEREARKLVERALPLLDRAEKLLRKENAND